MRSQQSGFLLIEGLIAILIFSFGILALVALQAVVVKEVGEAKFRMEATQFANQLIGQMWADDKLTLSINYASPDGSRYTQWKDEVVAAKSLPGAATKPPTVVFNGSNQVTVSIFWKQPGADVDHEYVVITQLQ